MSHRATSHAHERLSGLGDDAFLAVYGGLTAQVAWLTGDRLSTASVTCLTREQDWLVDAARSIAIMLDRRRSRSLRAGSRRHGATHAVHPDLAHGSRCGGPAQSRS